MLKTIFTRWSAPIFSLAICLPKVHESLDRFLDDFLHAVAFQGFYLSHVAELRHPHVNLEEHKNIT